MSSQVSFLERLGTPVSEPRAPFTSEMALQRFIEKNAKQLLGLTVLAVDRAGGNRFSRIDVLAVDEIGRPHIIELKHNRVDLSTANQLKRYEQDLLARWDTFLELAKAQGVNTRIRKAPVLVALGYETVGLQDLKAEGVFSLVYRYRDVPSQEQVAGHLKESDVTLHDASVVESLGPHPNVCKRGNIEDRLKRFPVKGELYWILDQRFQEKNKLNVSYSGKKGVKGATFRKSQTTKKVAVLQIKESSIFIEIESDLIEIKTRESLQVIYQKIDKYLSKVG